MDNDLISAYAHSNLHEALLAHLFADIIAREPDPQRALQEFRSDVAHDLQVAIFPPEDQSSPEVQRRSLEAVEHFFRAVEDILASRGVLKPHK